MAHTPTEKPICDVEVGTHPPPYHKDKNSGVIVCSRHKSQYEEREDEFGPFDWEVFTPEDEEEESIISVVLDGIWLDNLIKQMQDMDFCFVCDNHLSHEHAPACPLKHVKGE